MTPRQIRLLQRSFALIQPIADDVGLTFYERLFARAPEVRPMFKDEIDRQQRKLMNFFGEFVRLHLRSLLTLPVTAAQDPEVSIPGIAALAERHVRYGVAPEHFIAAKEALFWSFNQHLRDEMNHETLLAWSAGFDMIAESMIRVMAKQATSPKMPQQHLDDLDMDEEVESLADALFPS
jgi:hemoglobin-like flavoprotein